MASPLTSIDNNTMGDSITLEKQSNTILTLSTKEQYVSKNIKLTLGVKPGSAAVTANQSIVSNPTIAFSESNKLTASYAGSKSITGTATAGWVSDVTSATVSTSGSTTVTSLTLPKTYSFTINMGANTTSDTSKLTINNANYRNILINNGVTTNSKISIKAKEVTSDTAVGDERVVVENGAWKTTEVSSTGTFYGRVLVSSGSYTPSVVEHQITTSPEVTGVLTGEITTISTIEKPSGTDGTDYWSVTPSTSTTVVGKSSTKATATIGTAGYIGTGSQTTENANVIDITPVGVAGTTRYIPKAKFTVNNNLVYCSSAGYIPAGSSSSGVGTISPGTVTSGSATISTLSYAYNSTNSNFTITGSANVSAPTVNTAGYISSSLGTKSENTNGAVVSATVAKIQLKATSSSTLTYQPAIKRQTFTITGVTDASNGAETTTAPSSGVYVKVKSAAKTGTITVAPGVSAAGYGTTSNYTATDYTGTIGASASKDTYIPIKTATPAFDGGTLSGSASGTYTNATTDTTNTSGVEVVASAKASRTAVLYNGAVSGWVDKADNAATEVTAISNQALTSETKYITGVDIKKSKNFNITVPNGTGTITFNFEVDGNGNVLVT